MKTLRWIALLLAVSLGGSGCHGSKTCPDGCKQPCCVKSKACPADCKKPCCTKSKACPPDCKKPCCAKPKSGAQAGPGCSGGS